MGLERGEVMQSQARIAVESAGVPQEAGGRVIPLFRGRQESAQPLVTLGNAAWKKQDVMSRFRVSARTVERWQLTEGLPCEKPFGPKGPVRYVPAKVEAWWAARCANGGQA